MLLFYNQLLLKIANFLLIISSCLLVLPFGFKFTVLEEHYISCLLLPNKLLQSGMNRNHIYFLFLDLERLGWALCFRASEAMVEVLGGYTVI